MSISYKTPQYFSNFSCLGGDCEDTCCQSWEVKLDKKHYELLETAMSKDAHEQSMFTQYIHFNENIISSDHDYAFIRMGVKGYCALLDDKGYCSVHTKHGVEMLGDVCTMFPRVISRCNDTFELSGALSCPEVVRQCINDRSPLKLKRFKTSDLPRSKNYPIHRELSGLKDDFYSESFPQVRSALMSIMTNESHTLESRLYALAHLSHQLSSFYHRGCEKPDKTVLSNMLSQLSSDASIKNLEAFIADYESDSPISMVVVHSILSIKVSQAEDENITKLYVGLLQNYKVDNETAAEFFSEKLSEIHRRLKYENKKYIDEAITRYILNCLYREWFVAMPDPFTYIQMLLVRTSILRTLIYLDLGRIDNPNLHIVKERVVYIMYNFARNIDQNLEFLKVVYNALSEQSMMNYDFSPTFIRIY
ncbi:MAG: flagellin lysine-N-methylase [Woeseiaceae bacterium]